MSRMLTLRPDSTAWATALLLASVTTAGLRAQVEWTREGDGPVLSTSDSGWDSLGVHSPFVLKRGDELWMYYGGFSSFLPSYNARIGLAKSSDGFEWTKVEENPVLGAGPAAWESLAVQEPSVVFDAASESLFLWYAGFTSSTCGIGLATSTDGIDWQKHPEGATKPVIAAEDTWDQPCIDGYVLHDGTEYKLWYIGGGAEDSAFLTWKVGHATSTDGVHWRKYPGNPVLSHDSPERPGGLISPCVLWDAATETYEMWYTVTTGVNNGSIDYATSGDGVTWCKHPGNPVLVAGGTWDSLTVVHPMVLFDGKEYRMWYAGSSSPGRSSIGAATSPWRLPKASFTALPAASGNPLAIELDASKSVSPNEPIAEYRWDFGDGETLLTQAPTAAHSYARPGHYAVKLTVIDGSGAEGRVARGADAHLPACDVSPWTSKDIGEPLFPGSACFENAPPSLRVSAGGKLLAGRRSDQGHFVYQEVSGSGDVVLTAQVSEASGAGDQWEVGVMLRESLDAESRHIAMVLHQDPASARFRSVTRSTTGGLSSSKSSEAALAPAAWVRVERAGDHLIASASKDGLTWTEVKRLELPDLADNLLAGIFAAGQDSRAGGGYEALLARVQNIEIRTPPGAVGPFLRGDCNSDGAATGTVTDAVTLLSYSFLGGADPGCRAACDANADGGIDLSDAVYLLAHSFLGGPAPEAPFPVCAESGAPGDLGLGCTTPPAGCE